MKVIEFSAKRLDKIKWNTFEKTHFFYIIYQTFTRLHYLYINQITVYFKKTNIDKVYTKRRIAENTYINKL
jgi:hypothetical protein